MYAAALVALGAILARGLPFYLTPLSERAHHEGYWTWKPGGLVGHRLGWTGSSLMVLMLGYSLRKRVPALRGLGPLSRWLDVHILLGVVGPLLVVLHSALKVGGLVALSFWSMIAVAISGVLGRYLYLQIPRTRAGEALTLAELDAADRELSRRLRDEFGLDAGALQALEQLSEPPERRVDIGAALLGATFGQVALGRRVRVYVRASGSVPPELTRAFARLARQKALCHWRIRMFERLQELFHYWHVVHKPFAIVMYLFMLIHVSVAWVTGYGRAALP